MSMSVATTEVRVLSAVALRNMADAIESGASVNGADIDLVIKVLLDQRPSDPKSLRRLLLRRYWAKFYRGTSRCQAAKMIAADWLTARREGFVEPGSRDDFFRRIEAAGFQMVRESTITRDLDYDF